MDNKKTGMLESLAVFVVAVAVLCLQVQFPKFAFIPQEVLVPVAITAFTAFGAIVRKQLKNGGDK